jgi:transcriptional regulator with XRE-family HTH domain
VNDLAQALLSTVRGVREFFGLSRREAAPYFGISDRTLEEVEYKRTPLDPAAARMAAEKLKAPEIAIMAQRGGFPIYPQPLKYDRSLMATVAKGAKENREAAQVMEDVAYRLYNKDGPDDLTDADRAAIKRVIKENAEAAYVFHLLLILLVKDFGYGLAEIEGTIRQAIHDDGLI